MLDWMAWRRTRNLNHWLFLRATERQLSGILLVLLSPFAREPTEMVPFQPVGVNKDTHCYSEKERSNNLYFPKISWFLNQPPDLQWPRYVG